MASSSSYSASQSYNHDVFISFRGEDTRKTFVDHLYTALVDQMISVYKDDVSLPRGEYIRPSLLRAIEEAEIAVVIFSEKYGDSSWCLDELAHIMKCNIDNDKKLIVMPVFYGVVPSDVRKQEGKFGEGFAKQKTENNENVETWRKALFSACEIAGWDPKNIADGHESKAIKEIVDTISAKLFSLPLEDDENLVGMNARLQEMKEMLKIGYDGVFMVGICGVGGGGKTTLATSLCMKISSHFQGHCIVNNIREESSKNGLKTLQEKLLSSLLKTKIVLQSVEEGRSKIKSRLRRSNVLIILDDVNHIDQLEALVGSHNWFGSRSRIIITTRDEQLLIAHKVDEVYRVKLLTNEEAIELFNKRAYDEKRLVEDYETLSSSVVSYAAGLPLTLKLLGSFLYGRDEKTWKSTLARLKHIPEKETMEKLKISYDGLETDEKDLFLDFACFFRRHSIIKTDYNIFYTGLAKKILEACGYHLDIGIEVLKQKSLINIDKNGSIDMHDLVQQMGHYIVRGKYPNNPENHSRVWKPKEIRNLCFGDATMENNKTEVIQPSNRLFVYPSRFCKIVSTMKKLRWLKVTLVDDYETTEGPDFLSNDLRYINWTCYPRSPFPDNFQPMKLVVLELSKSLQKELWKDCKHLPLLKELRLTRMKHLLKTPHFGEIPRLQKLTLSSCEELKEIHPSFGNHKCLEYVSVSGCPKLRKLPMIVKMRKLNALEISGCHKSLAFPEIKSNMANLEKLSLSNIGIDALLSSIGERCSNLSLLNLNDCFHLKSKEVNFDGLKHLKVFKLNKLDLLNMLEHDHTVLRHSYGRQLSTRLQGMFSQMTSSLQKLILSRCSFRDGEIPHEIGKLSNLQELNLECNDFTQLHISLLQLTRLKYLNLSYCRNLIELPKLPSNISTLEANNCISLATIGNIHKDCEWLCHVSLFGGRPKTNGGKLLLESMLQGNHHTFLSIRGYEVAKRFSPPLVQGNSYRLKFRKNWCNDFCGFLICAVTDRCYSGSYHISMKNQKMSGTHSHNYVAWKKSDNDEETSFFWYVPFALLRDACWWDETYKAVLFSLDDTTLGNISGFGVRMVAKKSGSDITETLTTQQLSEFSSYLPQLSVEQDTKDGLKVWLSEPAFYSVNDVYI